MKATSRNLAVLLLGLALSLPAAAGDGVMVRTLDGEPAGLSELLSRDKWTLVMLWTTYCGVCRRQYPAISAFHDRHADTDAVVLGISLDGYDQAEKVARYRVEKQHSFPSVLAEADEFAEKFERTIGEPFKGTPTYLLFDREHELRAYLTGPIATESIEKFMAEN